MKNEKIKWNRHTISYIIQSCDRLLEEETKKRIAYEFANSIGFIEEDCELGKKFTLTAYTINKK